MSLINSTAIPSGASYELDQSLRFNQGDDTNLSKTFASAGNRKTWTFSCWFKRGNIGGTNNVANKDCIFGGINGDNLIRIGDDFLQWYNYDGSADYGWISEAVLRDTSAWYHALWVLDTTNSTATQRQRIYLNGIELTAKSTDYGNPPLNFQGLINSAGVHTIGVNTSVLDQWFDGYLSEVNFVDGQALTPADFAETGTYGEWKPIEYSGSYGTNGFYLTFGSGGIISSATGGNSTATDGNFKAASFTANGTFTPSADGYVEYLVIAGGGAGSADGSTTNGNGGGGAGGYRTGMLAVTASTGYAITVGAGGVGSLSASGVNGANSVFSTITSTGGGGGGYYINTAGAAGGSGGGGGVNSGAGGAASPAGQGFAGQAGSSGQGGGGGGAAEAGGTDGTGQGGDGLASSITGSAVTRAGGGGGSRGSGGARAGGTGGGGAGGNGGAGTSGTANTGGGGGAGVSGGTSGSGGTGIVIIRYKFQ